MEFLCHLSIRTESAERNELTADLVRFEIQSIHELLAAGTIRHAWKRTDAVAIVFLVDAASEEECRAMIESLPFSVAGILDTVFVLPVEPYLDVYPEPAAS
jgi:muconolactone delta-isomerase